MKGPKRHIVCWLACLAAVLCALRVAPWPMTRGAGAQREAAYTQVEGTASDAAHDAEAQNGLADDPTSLPDAGGDGGGTLLGSRETGASQGSSQVTPGAIPLVPLPEDLPYEPDTVLLEVAPGASADEVNAALAQVEAIANVQVSEADVAEGFISLPVAEGHEVADALAALASCEVAQNAQPDFIYYPLRGDETDLRTTLAATIDGSDEPVPDPRDATPSADEPASAQDAAASESSADVDTPGQDQAVPEADAASLDEDPSDSLDKLSDDTDTPNLREDLAATIDDPLAPDLWALSSMRVYEAWAQTTCDGQVGIAIMDEGPDATHEDLAANVVAAYDAVDDTEEYNFAVGHGTHVAGITAAVANNGLGVAGVSHNAGLALINVFYETTNASGNKTTVTNTSTLRRAYSYIADHRDQLGVRVVNLSLGVKKNARSSYQDDALVACINEAFAGGIVTVAAAGNSDLGAVPYYEYPGDAPNVVSVMNLRQNGDSVIKSGSSNYNVEGQTDKNIAAPGTGILSTTPGNEYGTISGTSMASPQVAGVLALEFAANPSLSSQEAVNILYATAADLGDEGWDHFYGWGEPDASAAVTAARTGEYPELPDISGEEIPDPVVSGPTRIPVGATARFEVENGSLELRDTEAASLDGTTLTGVKEGVVTLVVKDANGDEFTTRNVVVYGTSGCWVLHTALADSLVLDVKGSSVLNSGNIHIYTGNGKNNQIWLLEWQNDGTFAVRSGKSGKVLDVAGASVKAGANVIQYADGGKAWQRWHLQVNEDNSVTLVNAHSAMVLGVADGKAANSANVRQEKSADTAGQRWVLKAATADLGPIWDGVYRVSSGVNKSYVLDVSRASKANGGNVQLYKSNGQDNQRWRFEYLGKGVYRIINVGSGKALDVARGTLKNSVNIDQWSWNGGSNQRWQLVSYSDGGYAILRAGTSWAVDVKGGVAANGRNVHQYQRKNNLAQRWFLTQY